jgi:hypothetical protein
MRTIKKTRKNLIVILLTIITGCIFSSCGDDTAGPSNNYILDTAHYNWKIDDVDGDLITMWAYDTNNIFFVDLYFFDLIKYNGTQYLRYHFSSDFAASRINGVTTNEVYLGGYDNRMPEPTFGKPQLKIWNGSNFKTVNVPDTFNYYSYITAIYTGIPGVIWLGTDKGRVLRMQNNVIEETYIDTSQGIVSFLMDTSGDLFFLAVRDSCNPNRTYCKVFVSLFSYENTNWQKIFYAVYDNIVPLLPENLGTRILACDSFSFYEFVGNGYKKILDIQGFVAHSYTWGGYDISDLMCIGYKNGSPGVFHWNGNKWSNEGIYVMCCDPRKIINIQNKYICLIMDFQGSSYVYYGSKK